MANKIQLRRGVKANLPALDIGEPAFTTDSKELYIGASGGNKKIGDTADKLATARNIAVTGAVTGNANFDGSANISIATTLQALSAALVTSGVMSPARIQQDASNRFVTDAEKSTWNAKQSVYEFGYWTPSLVGTSGAPTYNGAQVGRYMKLGNIVYVWFNVQTQAKGNLTGNLSIGGFPFNCGNYPAYTAMGYWYFQDSGKAQHALLNGNFNAQGNTLQLNYQGQWPLSVSNITDFFTVSGGFMYHM